MAAAMGVSREEAAQLKVIPRDMAEWREDDLGRAYVHLHQPLDQIAREYGVNVPDGCSPTRSRRAPRPSTFSGSMP